MKHPDRQMIWGSPLNFGQTPPANVAKWKGGMSCLALVVCELT